MHIDNILSVYSRATPAEREEGMTWYDRQHALALELCPDDVWKGAGIIAAFSPNTHWNHNVVLAKRFVDSDGTMDSGTIRRHIAWAREIYNGAHPLDVFKGDKTRAFASAIADPSNSTIATIDRHAHDIAMGRVYVESERKIGKRVFRELSDAYVDAAFWCDIGVAQMQAITWVAWRYRIGVPNA